MIADRGVLVRRLNAIENLGSMDVLCTDKTGTLTEGIIRVEGSYDCSGAPSEEVLELAAFMGDTRRRGKVLWFLMTSRPDLVPVDLKRQGRAEEHIALFPPSSGEERALVFESLRARLQIPLAPGTDAASLFRDVPQAMSPADIEAVLVRASRRMAIEKQPTLSAKLLQELIADFQPPAYPAELEYQRLIAAFECTSRHLLPADLAGLSHDAIGQRLTELRAILGERRNGGGR